MSMFSFLKRDTTESVVLIDIGSSSIAGAYAHITPGTSPTIYYTAHVPIRPRERGGESDGPLDDMERALTELTETLVKYGASSFARATGSSKIDRVLASVAAPWQETHVKAERMSKTLPFRFTKRLMNELVTKTVDQGEGRTETSNTVIATKLNGYEVQHPFGKLAREAEVVVLGSSLDSKADEVVLRTLRKTFHAHQIELTAFAPVAYLVLRDLFPHEKDFLVLDVSGEATDLALVKDGLLVEVKNIGQGLNILRRAAVEAGFGAASATDAVQTIEDAALVDSEHNSTFTVRMHAVREEWLQGLAEALRSMTSEHALPRVVFLLADEGARDFLKRLIDEPMFRTLWLSDEPLPVISVDPGQLAPYVIHHAEATGDTFLSLLAIYASREG